MPWRVENGAALTDTATLTLLPDGRLCLADGDMQITFLREGQTGSASPSGLAMETKYLCHSADVSGVTLDASVLGGEYSLIFHADGTMDLVMANTAIPGATWTAPDAARVQIDYYGMLMEVTLTEAGCDMNHFDSMLLHFAP